MRPLKIPCQHLLLFALFFILAASSATMGDDRSIQLVNRADFNHESGKLGAYRALIIGIDHYSDRSITDLDTAVADAQAMNEILQGRYGFTTETLLDEKATRKNIYQALRKLVGQSSSTDSILIYFAGHGEIDPVFGDGWWVPSDASGGEPTTYLDNTFLQKAMKSMKARHVLLISDSCYSGTLFGKSRTLPPIIDDKYYLNMYNEKSRWALTSGNKTPVSDQGSGGHSVFAAQLLKTLQTNKAPYLSIQEIYTQIAPTVANNSEQTPLCKPVKNTGDEGGNFIFVARKTIQQPKTIAEESPPETFGMGNIDATLSKWENWQKSMERDFSTVKTYDNDQNNTPFKKARIWEKFLSSYKADNPYSQKDNEMKSFSKGRKTHWEKISTLSPTPSPQEPSSSQQDTTIKIAVIAGKIISANYNGTFLREIDQAIAAHPQYSVSYECRVLDNLLQDQTIRSVVDSTDDLWKRATIFSNYTPDKTKFIAIGKALNVDIVITFISNIGTEKDNFRIYGFNTHNGQMYGSSAVTTCFTCGEGENAIDRGTRRILTKLKQ